MFLLDRNLYLCIDQFSRLCHCNYISFHMLFSFLRFTPTHTLINALCIYLSLLSRDGSVQAKFLFWTSIRHVTVSEVASDICVTSKTYLIVLRRDRWLTRLSFTTPLPSVPPTFTGTGRFLILQRETDIGIHLSFASDYFREVTMLGILEC